MENKPGGLLEQPDCCMTEKDEAREIGVLYEAFPSLCLSFLTCTL